MMNLDNLNKWLTLTANIGVVIGIIFLAVEVRYAGNATELQTIEGTAEGWFRLNELIISDEHMARVFVLGLGNPEALSDAEAIQFSMYMRMFGNQVRRIRNHYEVGLTTSFEYERAASQYATFINTPGGTLYRETSPSFDETYLNIIEPYLNDAPAIELMLGRDIEGLK